MNKQKLAAQAREVVEDYQRLGYETKEARRMAAMSILADAKVLVTFGPEHTQRALDYMNMVSVMLIDMKEAK